MYIPKYVAIEELIPQEVYENTSTNRKSLLWYIFDSRTLMTIDQLRENHGKVRVNNWPWNGSFNYRGYRPPNCTVGAELSQHRFGRGIDSDYENSTAEEVRQDILEHPLRYPYITCIEMEVNWVHFDTRNYNGVLKIYP